MPRVFKDLWIILAEEAWENRLGIDQENKNYEAEDHLQQYGG